MVGAEICWFRFAVTAPRMLSRQTAELACNPAFFGVRTP
ncbi:hypothetical protein EV130_11498 [Rhizobium azibense]|uniref:Uncharacterized protein n=1 Tax=Rhizobium azibense TaxID=1136135 RepID=A0A4R3QCT7_9HYPH|nr:hypothetical protein EV130_11498 [Rhizobium azibense]TCU32069.1 hypothetical protein EV129_12217 [Rhizobium azibense]